MEINQIPAGVHKEAFAPVSKTNLFRHPLFICSFLFVLAAGIRFWFLFQVPGFLESNELEVTMQLVDGKRFPLFSQHEHIGALANYIVAIAFWILGKHYWVPRLVILILGSLTVSLTYLFGKRLLGRQAAFLGSLLLAASMYHIFNLSHVPWSNNMTPFFTTACLLFFTIALQEQKSSWLILSGFFFGLALQTHPSVLTLIPAMLGIFFLQKKERLSFWVRNPGFYFAISAALLGYANMIVYNIWSHNGSIHEGLKYPVYSLEEQPSISHYLHNSEGAWLLLVRLLSGDAEDRFPLVTHWWNPAFTMGALALVCGIILCLKQRKWTLPILLASPMLIIPAINRSYEFCKFGRYLGFLIPIACLFAAYALMEFLHFLQSKKPSFRIWIAALWMIIPAGYFFNHFRELGRTYAVLEYQDPDMRVFSGARKSLAVHDKKETYVMIDHFVWDGLRLSTYLQTDGWDVHYLGRTEEELERDQDPTEADVWQGFQQQVQSMHEDHPNLKPVVFISPLILGPFLREEEFGSLDDCLALGKPHGNFVQVLNENIYFLFSLTPSSVQHAASGNMDLLLSSLQTINSVLPASTDNKRTMAKLPEDRQLLTRSLKMTLANSCQRVLNPHPTKKCDICQENISIRSWDGQRSLRGRGIAEAQ